MLMFEDWTTLDYGTLQSFLLLLDLILDLPLALMRVQLFPKCLTQFLLLGLKL